MTNLIFAAVLATNTINWSDTATNALGGYRYDKVAHHVRYAERLMSIGSLVVLPPTIQESLEAITELNRIRHEQAAVISNLTSEVQRLKEELERHNTPPQWTPLPMPIYPMWTNGQFTFTTGCIFNIGISTNNVYILQNGATP
jgi:hypothetical protein